MTEETYQHLITEVLTEDLCKFHEMTFQGKQSTDPNSVVTTPVHHIELYPIGGVIFALDYLFYRLQMDGYNAGAMLSTSPRPCIRLI